jgi:two-component system, OmpR family, sensor histidine kinase CiaH
MHSAAGIEDRLFTPARVRLTAWYVSVLAAVLVVLGAALYLVVRTQLFNSVDDGVKLVAERAAEQWANNGTIAASALSTGPYTVNWVDSVSSVTPRGKVHYSAPSMMAAYEHGSDLRSFGDAGDRQRVYSVEVHTGTPPFRRMALIQVTRSTEPEHEALGKLLAGLLIGGVGGLALAAVGGWWLAGKSLRPVQLAFGRQHAFVSDASHELRTPLAVIRANAEFLQAQQPENAEVRDIVGETDRLSSLVDALLAVARDDDSVRSGHMPVDLSEVVVGTVASMHALANEHGLELTHAVPATLMVSGDRDQLRQALLILLDNAVRYTPAGGRIHVQARPDGREALLTVHDTGIGISQEALERVFERFYRGDEARNRQSGGVGLGLAIARELVTRHGGRISVTSTEGAGSTFEIRLPRGA